MDAIAENLALVRGQILAAAKTSGRDAATVKLIAVSKTHGHDAVLAALAAGQTVFGENRVQEAKAKFEAVRSAVGKGAKYSGVAMELHLVGPLQTNKAEEAVKLFDVIHTLDRPKLATELAKAMEKLQKKPRLYVEVNIGREEQKAGIAPEKLGEFLEFCGGLGLTIEGLMCIPPQAEDPASYFQQMKRLADEHGLARLSMGMSGDFKTAIACGATEVRVGTAIFGSRAAKEI